jgi:hypothetical protein
MSFNLRTFPVKFLAPAMAVAFTATLPGCSDSSPNVSATTPAVAAAGAPHVNTYTTSFPLKENPISEGGRWIGGKTVGLDWGDVYSIPGLAVGLAGPKAFADSTALLTGNWGRTQTVEEVVSSTKVFRYPEVSLRLRSQLAAHYNDGYEISYSLKDDDSAYLIMVRWNGGLADFTYLVNAHGKKYGVKTGDVVKATIDGDVLTTYKNDVLMGQVEDDRYMTGNPSFGFNEGKNGDYGIRRFTATDAPLNSPSAGAK